MYRKANERANMKAGKRLLIILLFSLYECVAMEIMVKLDIMASSGTLFLLIFPCCLNVSYFMERDANGKCANALF